MAIILLLQQVKLSELARHLGEMQVLPIVGLVGAVAGSLVTRAARWQIYFLPARRVRFGPLLSTLAISYMASTFLPLRAGELVRAVFLGQRERLPVPRIVGTILLEKLFDFLAIGVILLLVVARAPQLPDAAKAAAVFIATAILAGFGFVVGLAVWRGPTLRIVRLVQDVLPGRVRRRVPLHRAAAQFAEGTDSLRVPQLWVPLLGWTLITWLFSVASQWAGAQALGTSPTLEALLFWTVLTSTGQAVPSSPGYVGVYHGAATVALTAFGFDLDTALAVAVVTHAFSYGSLVVMGLIALWTGGYTWNDVLSGVRRRRATSSAPSVAAEPWPVAPEP